MLTRTRLCYVTHRVLVLLHHKTHITALGLSAGLHAKRLAAIRPGQVPDVISAF